MPTLETDKVHNIDVVKAFLAETGLSKDAFAAKAKVSIHTVNSWFRKPDWASFRDAPDTIVALVDAWREITRLEALVGIDDKRSVVHIEKGSGGDVMLEVSQSNGAKSVRVVEPKAETPIQHSGKKTKLGPNGEIGFSPNQRLHVDSVRMAGNLKACMLVCTFEGVEIEINAKSAKPV